MDNVEKAFIVEASLDKQNLYLRDRCVDCVNNVCRACSVSRQRESFPGAQSRVKVWNNMEFDERRAKYIHNLDLVTHASGLNLDDMPSNRGQAVARWQQLERTCSKLGQDVVDSVNEQITQNMQSGMWMRLSEVNDLYPNTKSIKPHYCALNVALKRSSLSTPVRLIADTALQTKVSLPDGSEVSLCFNDFLRKAGDTQPIHDLVNGLRSHEHMSQSDISKYYNSVEYTPESSVRLTFFIREGGLNNPEGDLIEVTPRTLVFGSRDSNFATAAGLFQCLKKFATLPELKYAYRCPQTSSVQLYVDDVFILSHSRKRLAMLCHDFDTSLRLGGFSIKNIEWVTNSKVAPESDTGHLQNAYMLTPTEAEAIVQQVSTQGHLGGKWGHLDLDEVITPHVAPAADVLAANLEQNNIQVPADHYTTSPSPPDVQDQPSGQEWTSVKSHMEHYDNPYLGLNLNLISDKIASKMKVCLYTKSRGDFNGPPCQNSKKFWEYVKDFPIVSKSKFLGLIVALFCLHGEQSPLLLAGRSLFSKLLRDRPNLKWSDAVPPQFWEALQKVLYQMMRACEEVSIDRYLFKGAVWSSNYDSVLTSRIFGYSDFSLEGYCFALYIANYGQKAGVIDQMERPTVRFLASRTYVAGTQNISIVLGELKILAKMCNFLLQLRETNNFPKFILPPVMLCDSLSAIRIARKSSHLLNRSSCSLAESIQSTINVFEDLYHIQSSLNCADLGSRGPAVTCQDLQTRFWLHGGICGLSLAEIAKYKPYLYPDDPILHKNRSLSSLPPWCFAPPLKKTGCVLGLEQMDRNCPLARRSGVAPAKTGGKPDRVPTTNGDEVGRSTSPSHSLSAVQPEDTLSNWEKTQAVSYTHLTLPTICSV